MLTIRFGSGFVIDSPDRRSHYSLCCSCIPREKYIRLETQTWKGSRKVKGAVTYLPVAGQYGSLSW